MNLQRVGCLALTLLLGAACGPEATSAAVSPEPSASAVPSGSASAAPVASATPAASTNPAPSASSAPAPAPATAAASATPAASATAAASAAPALSGPVRTEEDAIARALPVVDAALRTAYAKSKTSTLGGPHPQPFITPAEARVTRSGAGYAVRWSRHPPAGFALEGAATVTSSGAVKVTRADATFSPD